MSYDDDDEVEVKKEQDFLTQDQLLRLHYCAESNRKGMADHGMPNTMRRLEGLKFVKKEDRGYTITTEGLAYLRIRKDQLR